MSNHSEPGPAAHLLYLDAVAGALEAAGLNAGRAEDSSDEWRSGFINIATGPDGDPDDDSEDHFVLCWDWRWGWFSGWDSQDGIRWIEYYTGPINSSPAVIAAAASDRLAGNSEDWSMDQPGWGHDPDDDDHDAAFAAYLERDLAKFKEGRSGARS
jgi:hypothetical protein